MRSCDSEIMISQGSRPVSRSGTRSRWTSTPMPSRAIAAEVGNADRVAVLADARHGAREVPVGPAEAQAVEQRDRARAHRDDVAEDAADPRRRTLERLDGGRVVVRLGLERDCNSVA